MDEETADIVLSLQIEDMNRLLEPLTETQKITTTSDGHLALIDYRSELEVRLRSIRDRRMGRSIARAVHDDGPAVQEARLQENTAMRDRDVACRIGGAIHHPHINPVIDLTENTDDILMSRFSAINRLVPDLIDLNPGNTLQVKSVPSLAARVEISGKASGTTHKSPDVWRKGTLVSDQSNISSPSSKEGPGCHDEDVCANAQHPVQIVKVSDTVSNIPVRQHPYSLPRLLRDLGST